VSHDPHLSQILLSLRFLLSSLDQLSHHVRHLEQTLLVNGAALTTEKEEQPEVRSEQPVLENAETPDAPSVELPCRACGVSITRTTSGQLLDFDGGDHAQTCSLSRVCGNHLDGQTAARSRGRAENQPTGAEPLAARKNSSTSAARKRIERPIE
jgi:hypothetical protein